MPGRAERRTYRWFVDGINAHFPPYPAAYLPALTHAASALILLGEKRMITG